MFIILFFILWLTGIIPGWAALTLPFLLDAVLALYASSASRH